MDSIVFFYDKGKVIKGKVTYYEDWYEKWKAGLSGVEMMSIEFNEDEAPTGLTKEDFQGVYDQADEEFKDKMGVSYEEFCQAGEPSYKEIMKIENALKNTEFIKREDGEYRDVIFNKTEKELMQDYFKYRSKKNKGKDC